MRIQQIDMRNLTTTQNQIWIVLLLLVISLASNSCIHNSEKDTAKRPNIIFLMDDQHRWDALGVENPIVITPTLDKLASEGVRFTQAVCQAPMCIASRNSMMFGLYANQTGVLRNGRGIPDDKLPIKPGRVISLSEESFKLYNDISSMHFDDYIDWIAKL